MFLFFLLAGIYKHAFLETHSLSQSGHTSCSDWIQTFYSCSSVKVPCDVTSQLVRIDLRLAVLLLVTATCKFDWFKCLSRDAMCNRRCFET